MNTLPPNEIVGENEGKPALDSVLPTTPDKLQVTNVALVVIMTLAIVFMLDWAQGFIITMLLGILLTYTLNPVVIWLEQIKIPRVIGATLVILTVIGALVYSGYALRGQVQSIISSLPEAATKFTSGFASKRGDPISNMKKIQIAATQVEKATNSVDGEPVPKKQIMHVVIDERKFKIGDYLWRGSLGFVGFVGEAITMIFLAYFLLLSGDIFKRKLVRLTGPTLSRKKITVNMLDQINSSIQRYMLMLVVTNVMIGLTMWVALRLFELENAGAWSVAAGFLHVIPYFGPVVTAVATGMAAYMQFESVFMALLISGTSIFIATIIGVFVTTWMTGRIAKMNAAAVFISLLFFAWLWGVWGMLLGIPLIVIMKVVCEHVEHLQPIAEMLGD
ncbi:MAG: AI-2E family transporter [Pseudomonadota bacterium]